MEKGTHLGTELRSSPCNLPCSRACTESNTEKGMVSTTFLPTKQGRCPCGFSDLQIKILAVLKKVKDIISYWQIAQVIEKCFMSKVSEGAVRGALERLYPLGFLIRKRQSRGHCKGNQYAFISDPCPHIYSIPFSTESSMVESKDLNAFPQTSSFKDRLDSNLSIFNPAANPSTNPNKQHHKQRLESLSEDDIKFHFANLAKNGFGTSQIQQILMRLEQVGTNLENVMQGLTHAEWDLEHAQMQDKHGELIKSPTSWVFQILAKQGYYPRPKNYISPAEQIELDAKIETEALKKAKKEFEDEQYTNWLSSLSKEEKSEIIANQKREKFKNIPVPEDAILHSFYKEQLKKL